MRYVVLSVLLAMSLFAFGVGAVEAAPSITVENVSFPGDAFHYGDTVRVTVSGQPNGGPSWRTRVFVHQGSDPFYEDMGAKRAKVETFVLGTAVHTASGNDCACFSDGTWDGMNDYFSVGIFESASGAFYAGVTFPVLGAR